MMSEENAAWLAAHDGLLDWIKHQRRAPDGFRIIKWSDGFYHVYDRRGGGMDCVDETLDKLDAMTTAFRTAWKWTPACRGCEKCSPQPQPA